MPLQSGVGVGPLDRAATGSFRGRRCRKALQQALSSPSQAIFLRQSDGWPVSQLRNSITDVPDQSINRPLGLRNRIPLKCVGRSNASIHRRYRCLRHIRLPATQNVRGSPAPLSVRAGPQGDLVPQHARGVPWRVDAQHPRGPAPNPLAVGARLIRPFALWQSCARSS